MTTTADKDFLGTPEDEAIAGHIYDQFPAFEAGNQRNRRECVKIIAREIRKERWILYMAFSALSHAVGFIKGSGNECKYADKQLKIVREAIKGHLPNLGKQCDFDFHQNDRCISLYTRFFKISNWNLCYWHALEFGYKEEEWEKAEVT